MSTEETAATTKKKITKLTLKTQVIKIEITDPSILNELNMPEKYPNDLEHISTEIFLNRFGGKIVVDIKDKKNILRNISNQSLNKEMQEVKHWIVERS